MADWWDDSNHYETHILLKLLKSSRLLHHQSIMQKQETVVQNQETNKEACLVLKRQVLLLQYGATRKDNGF